MNKWLFRYIRPNVRLLSLAFTGLVFTMLVQLSWPFITKVIIDSQLSTWSGHNPQINELVSKHYLLVWMGIYVGTIVVGMVSKYMHIYYFGLVSNIISKSVRIDLMKKFLKISTLTLDSASSGEFTTKLIHDVEQVKSLFDKMMSLISTVLMMVGIVIAMFILDMKLAFISLLLFPVFYAATKLHIHFAQPFLERKRRKIGEANTLFGECASAMPVIHVFGREDTVRKEYEAINESLFKASRSHLKIENLSSWNLSFLIQTVFTAAILFYFGHHALIKTVSIGTLYASMEYLLAIIKPISGTLSTVGEMQYAVVSARKVAETFEQEEEPQLESSGQRLAMEEIAFRNVSFAYRQGEEVLHDLSFSVKRGQMVALIGKTGAGKTSIINLMCGFYRPTEGVIEIDGRSIADFSVRELRRDMAIVLQDPHVFSDSLAFNIGLGNEEISREQVTQVLRDIGAHALAEKIEQALAVDDGSGLSQGEKQLVAIARALVRKPRLLVLDEATASMDSHGEETVFHALKAISRSCMILVIAHRLSAIRNADRIMVIHDGMTVEQGSHEQLMEKRGRYARLIEYQQGMAQVEQL